MISFEWPWLFLLLPLPWLVRAVGGQSKSVNSALRVPFFETLSRSEAAHSEQQTYWLKLILMNLLWLFVLAAAAQPFRYSEAVALPIEQRDMFLAIDLSQSMQQQDMQLGSTTIQRIEAVKSVVSDFVQKREGDRLGLIFFGTYGFLNTPLTFDREIVSSHVKDAQLGFAGKSTALGDAIGLAIKHLRDRPAQSRVLVLLTDGQNTAGSDPVKAAEIAQRAGIRIHTVGIGADSMVRRGLFGTRTINPSADLDVEALTKIAELTGGQFFRAHNPQELQEIYQTLDEIETVEEEQFYRPKTQFTFYAFMMAAVMFLILVFLRTRLGQL